jgi:UDPglucose 6-dehydrogenase
MAHVVVTDPKALDNARCDLAEQRDIVEFADDPYEAAQGAHAIVVMTEWELYPSLDWKRIYGSMEKPAFVFGGRNILDHKRLFEIGFNVYPLGGCPLKHF